MTEEELENENMVLKYQVEQMSRMIRRLVKEHAPAFKETARDAWEARIELGRRMDFETYWSLRGYR